MPVVRPHNQQKGTKNRKPKPRNANQRKDTPSDLSATKNKSIIGDHHDSDNDETVYVASKKQKSKLNTKKTTKKILYDDRPLIKQFRKKIKNLTVQYVPEYLEQILAFLIEKEKKNSIAITNDKVRKWRAIRKNQLRIEGEMRKEVERIRAIIIKERRKRNFQDYLQSSESQEKQNRSSETFDGQLFESKEEFDPVKCWQNENCFNFFVSLVNQMLLCCEESQLYNSIFPSCYFLYMLLVSDFLTLLETKKQVSMSSDRSQQLVEYYFAVSLFIASKYHEIQPISIEQFIYEMNETLSIKKAEKYQLVALQLNDFQQFYSDHQGRFLQIMCLIVGWGTLEKNVCHFILQSGLNNPYLYQYSPISKALAVISLYEQRYLQKQEKYMQLRNTFPGSSLAVQKKIKKFYLSILEYNEINGFNFQKERHLIYSSQLIKLINSQSLSSSQHNSRSNRSRVN